MTSWSQAQELLAYACGNRGDMEGLFRHLQAATGSRDASPTAWYYLGDCFFRRGHFGEAERAFRRALELREGYLEAMHELGRALHEQGRYLDAAAAFERVLSFRPQSFPALHNAGRSWFAAGSYDTALARFDQALEVNPESALTWLTRGQGLHALGRMNPALESYAKALALQPDLHEARADQALTRLTLGQWDAGWPAFASRWRASGGPGARHREIAAWQGERPIGGKRILAWCEQGLGDTLQFCRYARLLMDEGANVVLEVQPALKPLLQASFDCTVVARGDEIPACDLQVPLMGLPAIFATTPQTVPVREPYLRADAAKVAAWNARVRRDGKPRIAVACSGRAEHKFDRRRSVSLDRFAPLADLAHVFVVQKDLRDDDRRALGEGGRGIDFLGDEIADFDDTAAIVMHMDLVVSIDTALVHLAGALGKPVWILLADVPDWRWMLGRRDSPWYPSARLFRQERPGDWAGVFSEVLERWKATAAAA